MKFIESRDADSAILFIDPPYFDKGKTLYLNVLDEDYHVALGDRLRFMAKAAWVLTYDDCPEIRRIYQDWATIRPFSLRYAASERRSGKEILIVPKWMNVPVSQESAALTMRPTVWWRRTRPGFGPARRALRTARLGSVPGTLLSYTLLHKRVQYRGIPGHTAIHSVAHK